MASRGVAGASHPSALGLHSLPPSLPQRKQCPGPQERDPGPQNPAEDNTERREPDRGDGRGSPKAFGQCLCIWVASSPFCSLPSHTSTARDDWGCSPGCFHLRSPWDPPQQGSPIADSRSHALPCCPRAPLPRFLLKTGLHSPGHWSLPFLFIMVVIVEAGLSLQQGHLLLTTSVPTYISFAHISIISRSAERGIVSSPLSHTPPGREKGQASYIPASYSQTCTLV